MVQSIKIFLEESRQELRHVHWPSREETTRYTLFVIGFSIVLALFLGALDYFFVAILRFFVF